MALLEGKAVSAHRGKITNHRVAAAEVAWIHVAESDLYGLVANLLPYRRHNDPIRSTMACNMLRQALTLKQAVAPSVKTGFESVVAGFSPKTQDGTALAYGTELWVGYLPWYGWNFEDALVISESAAQQLTSEHPQRETIILHRSLIDHRIALEMLELESADWASLGIERAHYDDSGILRWGQKVTAETLLVLEPAPKIRGGGSPRQAVMRHRPSRVKGGQVTSLLLVDQQVGEITRGLVEITFEGGDLRPATLGDKLANRHGHKGVISRILPDADMPYIKMTAEDAADQEVGCPCGERVAHQHLQMLINPLSVVSRRNLGQFQEMAEREGREDRLACFDPSSGPAEGRTPLPSPVLVGRQYILKLNQNAADKLNARSREPDSYSAFVEQPLRGRRLRGGQRVGEMETWALMAHAAPALLREMMTLKSDNPKARALAHQQLAAGNEVSLESAQLPEALRTFAAYSYGLGLKLTLRDKKGESHDPLRLDCQSEEVARLDVGALEPKRFLDRISKGEVSTSVITAPANLKYRYHPEGLESEAIFGPVESFTCACGQYKRQRKIPTGARACEVCGTPLLPNYHRRLRMGHIVLAKPVVNPYLLLGLRDSVPFISLLKERFGLSPAAMMAMSAGRFNLRFSGWEMALTFIDKVTNVSSAVRTALESKTGKAIAVEPPATTGVKVGDALPEATRAELEQLKSELTYSPISPTPAELIAGKQGELGEEEGYRKFGSWLNQVLNEAGIDALDLVIQLLRSEKETSSLVLSLIPVIPPDLRRRISLPNGYSRAHDVTELYKGVLRANEPLKKAASSEISQSLTSQRHQALQRAVAQLMCNHRLPNPRDRAVDWYSPGWPKRVRDSMGSFLEGKQGILVGHLLGKRVDYSARAVITLDPSLPMDKCRLPFLLAVRLIEPLLLAELHKLGKGEPPAQRIAAALEGTQQAREEVMEIANALLRNRPVLLNRQPTLHRLGLLAFYAQVGEGDVIAIPAQVTAGFNADFDGDQMAVYWPITKEARAEVKKLLPSRNLWHPANGRFAPSLAQDLALGGYLLCHVNKGALARTFETGQADQDMATLADEFVPEAFAIATRSGFSFGLGDLRELSQGIEGESGEMAAAVDALGKDHPIRRLLDSRARGDASTLMELAGGEQPTQPGFNLTTGFADAALLQRCVSGRRNLVDTKLGTAEGGWLTKVLVHGAQRFGIVEVDCGSRKGLAVSSRQRVWLFLGDIRRGTAVEALKRHCGREDTPINGLLWDEDGSGKTFRIEELEEPLSLTGQLEEQLAAHPAPVPPRLVAVRIERPLEDTPETGRDQLFRRLYGRVLAAAIPELQIIAGAWLDRPEADRIAVWLNEDPKREVQVRSPLGCQESKGLCAACHGLPPWLGRAREAWTLADLPPQSSPVGIIAAQAIGEPGTQMALRKKHLVGGEEVEEVSLTGIRSVMALLAAIQKKARLTDEEVRDTFDFLYRADGLDIAPIHFETVVRGMRLPVSWLGRLAHATGESFQKEMAQAAWQGESDPLQGLKERALVGAHVLGG